METLCQPKNMKVVVLDNDECTGQYSLASGIHNMFCTYVPLNTGLSVNECVSVLRDGFVKYYLPNGAARPGTKETLSLLKVYKDRGMIEKVVMYTSAGNSNDWVYFLKDCLEQYGDVKGLFDLVLHKCNVVSQVTVDGATVKDLDIVRARLSMGDASIFMFDDKPQNIVGVGSKIAVPAYRHIVDYEYVSIMLKEILNKLESKYVKVDGVTSFPPSKLFDPIISQIRNGVQADIRDNNMKYKCPINQLSDKHLIEKASKAFIDNIFSKLPLSRSSSDDFESIHKCPTYNEMSRTLSL